MEALQHTMNFGYSRGRVQLSPAMGEGRAPPKLRYQKYVMERKAKEQMILEARSCGADRRL